MTTPDELQRAVERLEKAMKIADQYAAGVWFGEGNDGFVSFATILAILSERAELLATVERMRGALGRLATATERLMAAWPDTHVPGRKLCVEVSEALNDAKALAHIPDATNMVAPVKAMAWRDIATAPRDGTMLLVGYDEGVAREGAMEDRQRVFEARWNDVQGTWSARNGFLLHSDATHWQPLPPPPSAHPAPINPSGDTGELRERMKRAIWTQLPQEDANMGTSGRIADTILDLIQSERAG